MACDVDRVHRRPLDGVFWLSRRSAELAGMQRVEANLEADSIRRVSWKLEAGGSVGASVRVGIERNLR